MLQVYGNVLADKSEIEAAALDSSGISGTLLLTGGRTLDIDAPSFRALIGIVQPSRAAQTPKQSRKPSQPGKRQSRRRSRAAE